MGSFPNQEFGHADQPHPSAGGDWFCLAAGS